MGFLTGGGCALTGIVGTASAGDDSATGAVLVSKRKKKSKKMTTTTTSILHGSKKRLGNIGRDGEYGFLWW